MDVASFCDEDISVGLQLVGIKNIGTVEDLKSLEDVSILIVQKGHDIEVPSTLTSPLIVEI